MFKDDKTTVVRKVAGITNASEQGRPYFIVLNGKAAGKMFRLDKEETVIGRNPENDIMIDDESVSRMHAKVNIDPQTGMARMVDLGSTNGTYFEGKRFQSRDIVDGDKIQVGSSAILKFSYQDSIEEAFQRQLYDSATKDGLTGIYNKRYFLERLRSEFSYSSRHQVPLSLALIDLDHFKQINDTMGHQAGDHVLREISATVHTMIRSEDVLARYGGEEFALILRQTDEQTSYMICDRIRKRISEKPFTYLNQEIKVSICVGIATLCNDSFEDIQAMISRSDEFLYKAKANGRNRVESIYTALAATAKP